MGYLYIFLTVLLTIYGQLILKWRLDFFGEFPKGSLKLIFNYFLNVLIDPYVISSFLAAFLASLTWIAALTKFEISFAYPFMSLSFVGVLIFSMLFLGETASANKIIGLILIIAGILVIYKL